MMLAVFWGSEERKGVMIASGAHGGREAIGGGGKFLLIKKLNNRDLLTFFSFLSSELFLSLCLYFSSSIIT